MRGGPLSLLVGQRLAFFRRLSPGASLPQEDIASGRLRSKEKPRTGVRRAVQHQLICVPAYQLGISAPLKVSLMKARTDSSW